MSLGDDLRSEVTQIFKQQWSVRDGRLVPDDADLKLSNDAVHFKEATVLYADMSASTELVNQNEWTFAAEVYKTFLLCAARVIRNSGGEITAYDGDRIMAVFIGDNKETAAARTALQINYCAKQIVNPAIKVQYSSSTHEVRHVVGVDMSELRVARTGIRGANDLVWVGRAANYGAKLSDISEGFASWITKDVYARLDNSAKIYNGRNMWEKRNWKDTGLTIYRSNWEWSI
ncbi:MAG: adenylate/guanylate cyclase domain-containing protein [Dehalococcoidia bacterium]|nr:adenylate/guanylate cyclase domain-containing protein [Dehalococcoidia bacterium]